MSLNQLGRKWQKILGLQHWNIKFEFHKCCEDLEMENDEEGYVHIDHAGQTAIVVVNENAVCSDKEIVAHELLHILIRERMLPLSSLLESLDAEKIYNFVDERLTQALEKVLMTLSRDEDDN